MDRFLPALKITGLGFYVATCIAGGALIGWWLGNKNPWFTIIGLVAGLIIAVYGVYRMIRNVINEQKNKGNS